MIKKEVPELDHNRITVDLSYCYPSKANHYGNLPLEHNELMKEGMWRFISSGDASQTNHRAHEFLANKNSFYSYLDGQSYLFCNDRFLHI